MRMGVICITRMNAGMARLSVGTICLRVRSIRRTGKPGIAVG